jgi:hypothetical protein
LRAECFCDVRYWRTTGGGASRSMRAVAPSTCRAAAPGPMPVARSPARPSTAGAVASGARIKLNPARRATHTRLLAVNWAFLAILAMLHAATENQSFSADFARLVERVALGGFHGAAAQGRGKDDGGRIVMRRATLVRRVCIPTAPRAARGGDPASRPPNGLR